MPDKCNIKVSDLYEMFVANIAVLPVVAFTQLITSLHNHLDQQPTVAIMRVLMPRLLPPAAPSPRAVHRAAADADSVSPLILEKCYLPFAYKDAENNTKLSLANEIMFRILWTRGCLQWTASLQKAVEKGVDARREKSASKKNNDGAHAARDTLRASGRRLVALAELLKLQEQEDDIMDGA